MSAYMEADIKDKYALVVGDAVELFWGRKRPRAEMASVGGVGGLGVEEKKGVGLGGGEDRTQAVGGGELADEVFALGGEAEVADLDPVVVGDEDVVKGQVSVDEVAHFVDRINGLDNLLSHSQSDAIACLVVQSWIPLVELLQLFLERRSTQLHLDVERDLRHPARSFVSLTLKLLRTHFSLPFR